MNKQDQQTAAIHLEISAGQPADEDIWTWRKQLVRGALRAMVVFASLALAAAIFYTTTAGNGWVIPFYGVAYLGLLLVTFWSKVSYKVQAWTLVGLIYGIAVLDLFDSGRGGDGRVLLLTVPLIAVIFFNRREGIYALIVDVLTLAAFAWAFTTHQIVIPVERQANYANPAAWLSNTVVLLMLGVLLVTSQSYIVPRLIAALAQSRKLVNELDSAQRRLREQAEGLENAHRLLAERTQALEATAELARDTVSIHDLPELLKRVVNLVSDRFEYDHTGIFLLDANKEWAVLQAASSEGGQRMLARGHRLRVGQEGIVGFVTGSGKARIALDVGADAVFFNNPDLPDTRSEMALPLMLRQEVIGALDVQSTKPNAFSSDEVSMLQAIADQVAMVISNVRLFQAAQESLEAERRAYGDLSRSAWNALLKTRPDLGYHYDGSKVIQIKDDDELELIDKKEHTGLELPIELRGHFLGKLEAYKPSGEVWSEEEISLAKTLTDQLGVALETSRLFQETRRKAERERLANEITAKIRSTNNPQNLLRVAAQELRQALQADRAQVLVQPGNGQVEEECDDSCRRGSAKS